VSHTVDSCDKGYFCTTDQQGATWCCPDGMSLDACAAAYNVPTLAPDTAPPVTTPTNTAAPGTTAVVPLPQPSPTDGVVVDCRSGTCVTMTSTVTAVIATVTSAVPSFAPGGSASLPSAPPSATTSIVRVSAASAQGPWVAYMVLVVAAVASLV
jgi:hypothetical protein